MAFGNTRSPFEEYGKRLAGTIQTGMKDAMAPKPPAPQAPTAQPPIQNPALQPQGLQPVEPISQAGQIYKQRVTQNLLNPNPLAQSAQATADTNISRRNYQTQKQTQEMMAQSPFGAGTRQYQRALTEGQAGANTANLGEQNQVNAYTRGLSEKAMSDAQGLEDTEFARALGERGYQDQSASRYSALIQDTKGRQAYNRMVASGMNPSVALQKVLDEGGTVNADYRGMNNIQQIQAEAGDWVEATTGLTPEMEGYKEAVRARMLAVDKAQQQPLSDSSRKIEEEDLSSTNLTKAIESGNYKDLIAEDYANLQPSQIREIQSKALNQGGRDILGDTWEHQANLKGSVAIHKWKINNPAFTEENIGQPVKYGDNTYILTKPYQESGGKDDRKLTAYGINIRTGKEEAIISSSEYDTEIL
jgi:hypothetical protein